MIPAEPRRWLFATLRATGWIATTVAFLLCGWNQWWALTPFATGIALATALVASLATTIPRIVTPASPEKKPPRIAPKTAILTFALIKYPMVAILVWWIVDRWETRSVVAFAAGFVCLQLVIGLRAAGRIWSDAVTRPGDVVPETDNEGNAIAAGNYQKYR